MGAEGSDDALAEVVAAPPPVAGGGREAVRRRVRRRRIRRLFVLAAAVSVVLVGTSAVIADTKDGRRTSVSAGSDIAATTTTSDISVEPAGTGASTTVSTTARGPTASSPTDVARSSTSTTPKAAATVQSTTRAERTSPTTANAACGEQGSETDLSAEPRYSTSRGLQQLRWANGDGCATRLDVLVTRKTDATFHCGPWPTDIAFGTPLGAVATSTTNRSYVEDPPDASWVSPSAPEGYAANTTLPHNAIDTGYTINGIHLYMAADSDSYIWLVTTTGIARWPRQQAKGCA